MRAIYDLQNVATAYPLVATLLRILGSTALLCMLGSTKEDKHHLTYTAKEIANFGRDTFLHLIGRTTIKKKHAVSIYSVAKLYIVYIVVFPHREEEWARVRSYSGLKRYFIECGHLIEDW